MLSVGGCGRPLASSVEGDPSLAVTHRRPGGSLSEPIQVLGDPADVIIRLQKIRWREKLGVAGIDNPLWAWQHAGWRCCGSA